MTTKQGIDIAWARPTVAQIKAVGAHFVMRYFSTDPKKNLTKADVTNYKAGGLETGVVWETTAGRAKAGKAAGVADAQAAEVQRKAVGLPSDMVIHFAVDLDTSWASVQAYFDGAISVLGIKRVGAYGSNKIIDGAYGHGIRYLWQTIAWSGGVQSKHATLYQHGGTTLGGGADWDTALAADYGQYPRPTTPEDDMTPAQAAQLADVHKAVVEASIKSNVDGVSHTLGAHTAATNGVAYATKAELDAVKKQLTTITTSLAAIAKKLGA